jgi:hypothetical protein
VLAENLTEIKEFIENNPKLKFAFNLKNKSAIGVALESKKFKSFALLKACRFRDNEFEDINIECFSDEQDKKRARRFACVQRRENVNYSEFFDDLSVLTLTTRSLIYNRDITTLSKQEQCEKIIKWLKEIYKTKFGSKVIDAAIQCKDLKIIFDFECESVSLKIYFFIN